jgi:hypothetical protein
MSDLEIRTERFHPGFINRMDAAPLPVMTDILGPGPRSCPELNGILGEYPCAALPDEINAGNIRAHLNAQYLFLGDTGQRASRSRRVPLARPGRRFPCRVQPATCI